MLVLIENADTPAFHAVIQSNDSDARWKMAFF
jgi:hypothetical protein